MCFVWVLQVCLTELSNIFFFNLLQKNKNKKQATEREKKRREKKGQKVFLSPRSMDANEWYTAVNELPVCMYRIFQLDHANSKLSAQARRYVAERFAEKNLAWNQFCTGETEEFDMCSADVSSALNAERRELHKLNADFLQLVSERQKNLALTQDLELILSTQLSSVTSPAEFGTLNDLSHVIGALDSVKARLAMDLHSDTAQRSMHAARERLITKLRALVAQLAAAIG